MTGPGTILSDFCCPGCDFRLRARDVMRTNPQRATLSQVVASVVCPGCGRCVRLSDARKALAMVLVMVVFFGAAIVGLMVVSQFDALTFTAPDGREKANFVAFLITLGCFVYPGVTLCNRVRILEIVE